MLLAAHRNWSWKFMTSSKTHLLPVCLKFVEKPSSHKGGHGQKVYVRQLWHVSNKGHFTHETESPFPLHFKHSHWWKTQSRFKFASHYTWGTNGVCECKIDVKSTWIPTWHQMDHVFMVIRIIFKNHLLEVGLTQNCETMTLQTLTSIHLFYFIMCEE